MNIILHGPDIADEIYKQLLKDQVKYFMCPNPTNLTPNMRSILIDWLLEMAVEYKLHKETLRLAVNHIDCFLGRVFVGRGKL